MHKFAQILLLFTLFYPLDGMPAADTLTPDETRALGVSNDELLMARDSWQPFKNKYGWMNVLEIILKEFFLFDLNNFRKILQFVR